MQLREGKVEMSEPSLGWRTSYISLTIGSWWLISAKISVTPLLSSLQKMREGFWDFLTISAFDISTLQEHQWILTNAELSKDSDFGFIMMVYEYFLFLVFFFTFWSNWFLSNT